MRKRVLFSLCAFVMLCGLLTACKKDEGVSENPKGDKEVFYTVSFVIDGEVVETQKVQKGDLFVKPKCDVEKEGFVFREWQYEDGTSVIWESPIRKGVYSDITLIAKYDVAEAEDASIGESVDINTNGNTNKNVNDNKNYNLNVSMNSNISDDTNNNTDNNMDNNTDNNMDDNTDNNMDDNANENPGEVEKKLPLRILMIGNSFSDDTSYYLPDIYKDLGYDSFEVGNAYIGGCSIDTHYSNASNNKAAYYFRYYENGEWNMTYGEKKQTLEYAIRFKDWDIITFQQVSGLSGIPSTYSNLSELVSYVEKNVTNENVQFFFNMTWAYQGNSSHKDFANYDNDQMTMYNAIVSTVQSSVEMPIIPNGTAIQNARTSYIGDNLTRDGYHLTMDFGRYIAGLTLMGQLGFDISEVSYLPTGLTDGHYKVAIESATNALKTPYSVTDSEWDFEDVIDGLVAMDYEDYGWTKTGGFWYSTHATMYKTCYTLEEYPENANTSKYVATKRFTRDELPVGSVIKIESGWSYRPEAWVNDGRQSTRPGNVTTTYIEITEEWWGDYIYRAFNIGNGTKLNGDASNPQFETAKSKFTIYVPKSSLDSKF